MLALAPASGCPDLRSFVQCESKSATPQENSRSEWREADSRREKFVGMEPRHRHRLPLDRQSNSSWKLLRTSEKAMTEESLRRRTSGAVSVTAFSFSTALIPTSRTSRCESPWAARSAVADLLLEPPVGLQQSGL
jgi:hypothetical protein